jgi:hypothetical protein
MYQQLTPRLQSLVNAKILTDHSGGVTDGQPWEYYPEQIEYIKGISIAVKQTERRFSNVNASDKIKQIIRDEFKYIKEIMDFDKKCHEIFRSWYVDGRLFYLKVIDVKKPQEGIKEIRYIDPMKIKHIRQEVKEEFQTPRIVGQTIDNKGNWLPKGIDDGQYLKVANAGDFKNGEYGDLILQIQMVPKDGYEKINNDLIYNLYLNLEEAQKDKFTIPHPDGKLSVKFPKEFNTQVPLRIKYKGFINGANIGDLFIKMNVRYTRS